MSARTADCLDAIEHLPDGATLVIQQFSWDEYERLLEDLRDRPRLRVTYDEGRLEIMSPLPEHEEYGRLIDLLVRIFAQAHHIKVRAMALRRGKAKGWPEERNWTAVITLPTPFELSANASSIWKWTLLRT